jgi:hypothetical protein
VNEGCSRTPAWVLNLWLLAFGQGSGILGLVPFRQNPSRFSARPYAACYRHDSTQHQVELPRIHPRRGCSKGLYYQDRLRQYDGSGFPLTVGGVEGIRTAGPLCAFSNQGTLVSLEITTRDDYKRPHPEVSPTRFIGTAVLKTGFRTVSPKQKKNLKRPAVRIFSAPATRQREPQVQSDFFEGGNGSM